MYRLCRAIFDLQILSTGQIMNIKETLSEGLAREYEITFTAAEMDEKVSARLA